MADNTMRNDLSLTYSPSHQQSTSHNFSYYPVHNGQPMLNHPEDLVGSLSSNLAVNPATALRTFASTKELANHYRIPEYLPPVPRTTPREPHIEPDEQQDASGPADDLEGFKALQSSYLSMLATNPTDISSNDFISSSHHMPSSPAAAIMHDFGQPLGDSFSVSSVSDKKTDLGTEPTASPEFRDAHSIDPAYLTSPLPTGTPLDTPYSDFAPDFTSPYDDSPLHEFLTTPLIADESDPVIVGEPLFPEMGIHQSLFGGHVTADMKQDAPKIPDLDNLYTISPEAPFIDSVDPTTLASPEMPTATSFPPTTTTMTTRKRVATGTRKNLTPDSLIPLDAPTQSRKYVLPSSTSRKEVPAGFANKRKRAQAWDDDEEDELEYQEPLRANATEKEKIEYKRRQNTLAARKSRKRKLEYQLLLEERVENLEREVGVWKTRAQTLQSVLRKRNIPVADFPED